MSRRGIVFSTRLENDIDLYMQEVGEPMDPRTVISNLYTRRVWGKLARTPKRLAYYFKRSGQYVQIGASRPFTYIWSDNYDSRNHGPRRI